MYKKHFDDNLKAFIREKDIHNIRISRIREIRSVIWQHGEYIIFAI